MQLTHFLDKYGIIYMLENVSMQLRRIHYMTGCLKIKNDTFYAVLNLKEGNKYKQKWVSTKLKVKGNKYKATDFLNKLMAEYEEKEAATEPADTLFTDYLMQWLEKKKSKVDPITWQGYSIYVNKHIVPFFQNKNLTLSQLKPHHVSDYYDFKFTSGRLDGKPGGLAVRTIKSHSLIIKEVLDDALIKEIIPKNVASKVPLPKQKEKIRKETFLNAKEANEVLSVFKGHHLQALIYMTLYYGLRRSEVLGLKWSAIDFKNNKFKINHTIVKHTIIVAKDKTKTEASRREYTLLPEIKAVLLNLQKETKMNRKLFGKEFLNSDYVFTWPDGRPYRPDYITKEFQKVLSKNNFPHMRFHDLRHSCASILYDKGWDLKDIQLWLGHADIETTANIYTHISKARKEFLTKDLENTFAM